MAAGRLSPPGRRALGWTAALAATLLGATGGWACHGSPSAAPSSGAAHAAASAAHATENAAALDEAFLARWRGRRPDVVLRDEVALRAAAQSSAADLAARGVLSHHSLGTPSPLQRYRRCGGTGRRVGEVLGVGPSFDDIWLAWEASASHAAVIDADGWRRFGVAAVELPGGLVLVVLLLGNSALDGVRTEPGWAHVTIVAELVAVDGAPPTAARPPLLLGWNGAHLSGPAADAAVAISWYPSAPYVRIQVPFDGDPAWLLVGVGTREEVGGAAADYTDRLLIEAAGK